MAAGIDKRVANDRGGVNPAPPDAIRGGLERFAQVLAARHPEWEWTAVLPVERQRADGGAKTIAEAEGA